MTRFISICTSTKHFYTPVPVAGNRIVAEVAELDMALPEYLVAFPEARRALETFQLVAVADRMVGDQFDPEAVGDTDLVGHCHSFDKDLLRLLELLLVPELH